MNRYLASKFRTRQEQQANLGKCNLNTRNKSTLTRRRSKHSHGIIVMQCVSAVDAELTIRPVSVSASTAIGFVAAHIDVCRACNNPTVRNPHTQPTTLPPDSRCRRARLARCTRVFQIIWTALRSLHPLASASTRAAQHNPSERERRVYVCVVTERARVASPPSIGRHVYQNAETPTAATAAD